MKPIDSATNFNSDNLSESLPSQSLPSDTGGSAWSDVHSELDIDMNCDKCLDEGAMVETKCGHYFHVECMLGQSRCPSCNEDLSS